LLIFHGTADGIFSASESVDYFERLAANNGGVAATRTWARLFLIPGMNHCLGGPATDSYDGLSAIVHAPALPFPVLRAVRGPRRRRERREFRLCAVSIGDSADA